MMEAMLKLLEMHEEEEYKMKFTDFIKEENETLDEAGWSPKNGKEMHDIWFGVDGRVNLAQAFSNRHATWADDLDPKLVKKIVKAADDLSSALYEL